MSGIDNKLNYSIYVQVFIPDIDNKLNYSIYVQVFMLRKQFDHIALWSN